MIDGMLQDSIDKTLDDRQQRPVAEPRQQSGFSVWNTIKAPVVGAAAGGVESGGFAADVIGAFGQVQAGYGAQADPSLLLSPDEMQKRRDAGDQAREQVQSGEAFSSEIGTGLRTTARSMMPDPATSNVLENVLFQGARGITKAVGYSLAAGPVVGATLFGADEALTEADRLKAEGVDIETRTKVGAITGIGAGVGAALPVAGRTIAQTAALVVAGGPAAYIAQQAASREILKNADYSKVSDQYDPFDPVGLAVSTLVPAAFGGLHMRGQRGARPGSTPPVDAAAARALLDMGGSERKALPYNDPRLDAYAVTAAQREGVPPELMIALKNAGEKSGSTAVSPKGARGVAQFIPENLVKYGVKDPTDPVQSLDGMAKYLRDTMKQYNGDIRAVIADYNGGPRQAKAVLEGKLPPAAETSRYLARVEEYMAQRGGEAVGRARAGDPEAVAAARTQLIRDTVDSWNLKDPTDIAAAQDHLHAVVKASDQLGAGSRVDVSDTIQWDTLQQARMLDDMVGRFESARADLLAEAGQAAEPGAIRNLRTEIDQLRRAAPDNSDEAIRARAKELQDEGGGRVSYKQAQAAAKKEIAAALDEHTARLDSLERQVETNRSAEQARQAVQQLDQQIAGAKGARAALDAPPSPVKATALAAKQTAKETPAKAPGEKTEGGGIPPLNETPGGNTETQAAAAAAKPGESATGAQAAAASVDAQAAEIAKLSPDMMVQLEGMDAPVRLADALEAVKAEAARDAADAPLIQAAAECFLRIA
ncbi:transglycosylase SLT domain-containing protein [Cupriavidus sp.]|uniref:lytic transglycosylase domain-containing protein n=2 Tax=unclassified Cupriavidus TaxID=2640874 RepID=UPI0025BA1842|nr:transglycosylase SLT domain-containing protein [Cupriavidus sp.]MCA3183395.1 transglycosylase SLT domain-containing protein [Cupriavidus sp.]MCA3189815.1 transglycosylase SLT domain-containing protein [Cupriavidus sp.]MCA3196409.1 transglycosylase SLT domain-containing protein [Cupriavidus sp.]MCA3202154.1 transglycosylase SLT domain-containing protein [Cupriavidus sp.]MCA3232190.1 transglycosylase SLT domain-containing protein [Cupriavidus sp.]